MSPDTLTAWQCIGCGALEAPAECMGVCQYRAVQVLDLPQHQRCVAANRQQHIQLQALLRQLANTHPHPGREADVLRAFQQQAKQLLKPPLDSDPRG